MASAHNVPYFTCTGWLIWPGFFHLPVRFLFVVFKTLVHQMKSGLPLGDESIGIIGLSLTSSSLTMSPPDNRIIWCKVCCTVAYKHESIMYNDWSRTYAQKCQRYSAGYTLQFHMDSLVWPL
jgi:hypothetical protein